MTLQYLKQPVYAAALNLYRLVFGLMIAISMARFSAKGWINELYVKPVFFFRYYGFGWVPEPRSMAWLLFLVCGVAAVTFAIGLWYRLSAIVLFISFTWIELLDKSNYLNHYYFVSLILFLMIWMPAHHGFSVDAHLNSRLRQRFVPRWTIGSLRLMMGIVYVYAGLAKLNSDWLLSAMPLRLWLPAKNDLPFLGAMLSQEWIAYFFSWFGACYDLFIVAFLLWRPTRPFAYATVVIFHTLTAILFPIGVFPYVMMVGALIFFSSKDADRLLNFIRTKLSLQPYDEPVSTFRVKNNKIILTVFAVFFCIQFLMPWRYLWYPGELFWTEDGYRFSWRVMLMEKAGYAQFLVKDGTSTKVVNNEDFLTKNQEKMMATQPDFILQYAHHLKQHFSRAGFPEPKVYATVYVGLNGRMSQLFFDPQLDLTSISPSAASATWLAPFGDTIWGL